MWATPKCGAAAVPEVHERRSRVALTVTWMAATLAIALFVPDIGKVIELIGGISAFFIFIFPGKSEQWDRGEGVTRAKSITVVVGLQWWVPGLALIRGCRSMLGGTLWWPWVKGVMAVGGAEPLHWWQDCASCA